MVTLHSIARAVQSDFHKLVRCVISENENLKILETSDNSSSWCCTFQKHKLICSPACSKCQRISANSPRRDFGVHENDHK